MKLTLILASVFLRLLISGVARGQAVTDPSSNDNQGTGGALSFVKIAATVAENVRHRPLNNYLGIYVSQQNWSEARRSRDLGPFFQIGDAKPKPGRSAGCVVSPERDIVLCVYFNGDNAYGVATVKMGVSGRIEPHQVALSYRGATKDMLKQKHSVETLQFLSRDISTEDGHLLPAFTIKTQKETR